jgi:hypothetical protein
VGRAVGWATRWWGNTYFAEFAFRELLSLTGRWASLKSLFGRLGFGTLRAERLYHVQLIRDIFGNPFHPVTFSSEWRTDTALSLARAMYESRDFSALPILADAVQDAGCTNDDILNHCRGPGPHVRGCWCVDLVLSKE